MGRTYFLSCLAGTVFLFCAMSCETSAVPEFDSSHAFADLERQVTFGPRVPGTEAHSKTRDWLTEQLRTCTSHVAHQEFSGIFAGDKAEMCNIVASFYPEKKNRFLLCAHWDCRPFADKDPDPVNHSKPVDGANDGASGVAVLLEIARLIKDHEPSYGVDIAFFDGEDGGAYGQDDTWLLGSRHFAENMPSSYIPRYAVLLDMIGDKDLSLSKDYYSMESAPHLWENIQKIAGRLGIPIMSSTSYITDDHIPLIKRGIPSVDIIDFDYASWHTTADTPDKCSAESLGKIGALISNLIYKE